MSSFLRFLSFVPPTLFFFLPAFSQVQGKLEQIPGSNTFQVSVISTVNWSPPQSITSSAQFTLRATAGKVDVATIQNQNGIWEMDTPILAPVEAPGFDYFSFYLAAPIDDLNMVAGADIPLFSFANSLGCTYIEIIDNDNDPFLPPNSANSNIGNTFAINGSGMPESYEGNSAQYAVDCPPVGLALLPDNNPVLCNGDATAVTVQALMGTAPYTVTWVNTANGNTGSTQIIDYEGTASFPGFQAGNYEFTIVDVLQSTHVEEMAVTQPAIIEIELTGDDAACNGSMDGQAFVSDVDGGTVSSDYQYFWNTNPAVSSQSIGFLDPGTYTVTVVDDNGCDAEASVEIGSFSIIIINSQMRDISCYGANDGVIDLYPVSLNGPYTFAWSSNVAMGDFSSAWMLEPGSYDVTVTDNSGMCTETASFVVDEPEQMEVDFRTLEPTCFGEKGYLDVLAVSNAFLPWSAKIIGNAEEISPNTFEVEAGQPFRLVVTDEHGCEGSEDFIIPAKQEIFVDLGQHLAIKYGETVQLDADIYPQQNVTLQWTPSDGLSCSDCPNPSVTPEETITYRLVVIDTSGCSAEDHVTIGVTKSRDIYIPNAFSPNHDGINDKFCPYAGFEVVAIHSLQVFDRWGGIVYTRKEGFDPKMDPKIGWDGTARGKHLDAGTYLYTMNVEFIDGETILYSGEVNLMR